MKKAGFSSIVVFFLLLSSLSGQRGQAVYAEILGNGLLFSFNYDV